MKTTAISIFIITVLIAVSGNGSGASKQTSGGTGAPFNLAAVQPATDLHRASQSGCAKWRQFASLFSANPEQANLDEQLGGAEANC